MPLSIQNGNELNWQGIFEMLRDLCQNHNNEDILMICSLLNSFWENLFLARDLEVLKLIYVFI